MRAILLLTCLLLPVAASAQAPGKWPPDSLINLKVLPASTPVVEVVGQMRNFASALGVRCEYCHAGERGAPLERIDFASDEKRAKRVARQMMLMLHEINRRVDTIPEGPEEPLAVTCATCHRGLTRPVPLATLMTEITASAGADSAARAYRALRTQYHGRDAYDFGHTSLLVAAGRLARAQRHAEAEAMLALNEEFFPNAPSTAVTRGNLSLARGDTTAAIAAYREALRRDSTTAEARARLRALGSTR